MATETVHQLARTATGEVVRTPPHVTRAVWAAYVPNIAIVPGGCHLWLGELWGSCGYGVVRAAVAAYDTMPHLFAFAAFHGQIPPGAQIMHECDEPLCAPVTPEAIGRHLRLGDAAENARERNARGRAGSRRHGVKRAGADTRARYQRSLAMQIAVRYALSIDLGPEGLRDVVAHVQAAGDPNAEQLSLLPGVPAQRLRVVR